MSKRVRMKRIVLTVVFGCVVGNAALADVCVEGASLDMPDHRIIARLGLSAIVHSRRHPAMQDLDELRVSERAAAFEVAFADEHGDKPEAVQDLHRLGIFAESFNLDSSNDPSLSVVFFQPELLMASLPTLRTYDVRSGVQALEAAQDAFWFFESRHARQLLNQLRWNSVIGATVDDARDAAPDLLNNARGELDATLATMEAEDPSVAAVMDDLRATISDFQRRSYLEYELARCVQYDDTWGQPTNWDDIPQLQKDLLVLSLLEFQFDDIGYFYSEFGWLLDDAIRVTQEQGLVEYATTFRQGLAVLPRNMERVGEAWSDAVWDNVGSLENIVLESLREPLSIVQGDDYEVSYDTPLYDAFDALARPSPLWPGNAGE